VVIVLLTSAASGERETHLFEDSRLVPAGLQCLDHQGALQEMLCLIDNLFYFSRIKLYVSQTFCNMIHSVLHMIGIHVVHIVCTMCIYSIHSMCTVYLLYIHTVDILCSHTAYTVCI